MLAQVANFTGGTNYLTVYGPFAPFALALIVAVAYLWRRLVKVQDQKDAMAEKLLTQAERLAPILIEATQQQERSTEVIQDLTSRVLKDKA